MRIYFYFSAHERLFLEVAKTLSADYGEHQFGGFLWGYDQRDFLQASGFPWARLDVFSDWLREAPDGQVDLAYLRECETRYGLPNLALAAHGDRLLARRSYGELLRIIELTLRRAERLFEDDRPDAMIFESVDGLVTLLLHLVGKKHGVTTYILDARAALGRTAVYNNHLRLLERVDEQFERQRDRPLTEVQQQQVSAFMDAFRSKGQRPAYYARFEPALNATRPVRFLRATRRFFRDPYDITRQGPIAMLRQRAERILRSQWVGMRGYFERPVPGEAYVLFPLHQQPEASTLICGPFYLDQPSLIEDIAKSLPVGYRLYVKEHFVSVGRRSLHDYRRIKRLWNVRLIGPEADLSELVKNASAVATIAGTMGWEALLLERPVITFGEVFYNSFPLVVRAGRLSKAEWPAAFARVLRDPPRDPELLRRFVASVLAGTDPEPVRMGPPNSRPEVLAPGNVRRIASVFARAMGLERAT